MGSLSRLALTAALGLGSAAGCGDPVVVLGDWPGLMRIVAGVPDSAGTRVDERATKSLLVNPAALAVTDDGLLYIAARRRILAVASSGELSVVLDHERCSTGACLSRPEGLALDGRGGLLVADPSAHRIFRIDLASGTLEVVAGTGRQGSSPDGTPAPEADLAAPTGIAVGPDGTVYFSERAGAAVRTLSAEGGSLGTLAGTGQGGSGGDGGPAASAQLSSPAGLALGGGVLYIADSGNNAVRAVDLAAGTIERVAGSGAYGFAGDDGLATEAQLKNPQALVVSADGGTLYVADTGNDRVRSVHLRSGTIATFAGTGRSEFNGSGHEAGGTSLSRPTGLAVAPQGLLFIADSGHHIVWRTPVSF